MRRRPLARSRSRLLLALATCVIAAPRGMRAQAERSGNTPPAWTRGATCYEIFVRSFQDSDGDGIGDINGLIQRLDYINDGNPRSAKSLGARCLWLMPIAASPSYHGYDVSDYYRVNPQYGTNADFKRLVTEAHKRGIKVLVDMVLNHSSSQHPYFQAALHDTTSPYRQWYRFSPTKPSDLNPWGYSNWHQSPVRDEWYYAFFSDHMPDLAYTNPAVVAEAKKIARYWLIDMGADGFRLDAVPYLVEENGQIQHTAGTHAVLRDYAKFVRAIKPEAYTVGEVSDSTRWLLGYYPDQLDAYFAFEVADSLISAANSGVASHLLAPVLRLQRAVPPSRLALFIGNHDQPRVATKLHDDPDRERVAAFLLLTMPGVPFVYYGEEIGMAADKPDERLRTPMQWTPARGAGFTSGTPWERLADDSLTATVQAQDARRASLLDAYRTLIHLRSATPALASGELVPLTTSDSSVTAYLRRDRSHVVLMVANLGRGAASSVRLDSDAGVLRAGTTVVPRTLFGSGRAAKLRSSADGRIAAYVPLAQIAPMQGYVFDLGSTGRP